MYRKPFYAKWKRGLKLRGAELAGSKPGLSLYCRLLKEQYDVFKEHQPSQADLIQCSSSILHLTCFFFFSSFCNIILTSLAFMQFVKAADGG